MKPEQLIAAVLAAPVENHEAIAKAARGVMPARRPEPAAPERLETLRGVSKATGISTTSLWRARIPEAIVIGTRKRYRISQVMAHFETQEFKDRMQELSDERKAGRGGPSQRKVTGTNLVKRRIL